LIEALFAMEAPEVASGTVELKAIAREPGSRSKIAVWSNDEHVDPVGSCVGQKGIRVTTVMSELGAEKIDIIPYDPDPARYVANSLSPARVLSLTIDEAEHKAHVEVADEQLSLAIGKGGQNVRLAAKLTGWRIDIKGVKSDEITSSDGETVEVESSNGEVIAEEGAPQDTNAQMDELAEEVQTEGEE
jgi:N utilization substance protein A